MTQRIKAAIPYNQKMTLWTNSLSAFVSKSDRADQPFNLAGAREGQGQHFKKSSKHCAQGRKKGRRRRGARTKRVPPYSGPPARYRSAYRRTGAGASHYGRAIAFPRPRGEESREKKMTEKMYVNAPRLQAQCRPCTPQCTPMQGPALPMRRECKRRL